MSSISDFLENEMLDHTLNGLAYPSPATVYCALFEGAPTDTGLGGTEASGNSYARVAIPFGPPSNRRILNSAQLNFPQASGPWQTTQLDHFAIFNQLSGGDFLAWGTLQSPIQVVAGNTPTVAVGQVDVYMRSLVDKGTQNNMSDYAAESLLNHVFRNSSWAPPATYLGYATAVVADSDTGASVAEPGGGVGYSRLLANPNGGGSPQWRIAASGVVRNQDALIMPTPTGSWGTLTAGFLADALSGGNLLFYDNSLTPQAVGVDDTVRVAIDQFTAALT